MRIAKDCLVSITRRVTDEQGNLVDGQTDTISYVHGGYDDIFPKIEAALDGQEPGFSTTVTLAPEEAFGAYDPEKLVFVEREAFEQPPEVGSMLEREDSDDIFVVKEVHDDKVLLEGNHPLAGITLLFTTTVTEVRPASPDEIRAADRAYLSASIKPLRAIRYGLTMLLLMPVGGIVFAGLILNILPEGILQIIALILLAIVLLFGLWSALKAFRNAFRSGEMLNLSGNGLIWRPQSDQCIPWPDITQIQRAGADGDYDYIVTTNDHRCFTINSPVLSIDTPQLEASLRVYLNAERLKGM